LGRSDIGIDFNIDIVSKLIAEKRDLKSDDIFSHIGLTCKMLEVESAESFSKPAKFPLAGLKNGGRRAGSFSQI
jgi:hypothetical protein